MIKTVRSLLCPNLRDRKCKVMTDGEKIARAREAKGLSLRDAAKRLGISRQCWHQWESGYRTPTLKTAHRIADALDTSLSEMLR